MKKEVKHPAVASMRACLVGMNEWLGNSKFNEEEIGIAQKLSTSRSWADAKEWLWGSSASLDYRQSLAYGPCSAWERDHVTLAGLLLTPHPHLAILSCRVLVKPKSIWVIF
ncbi:hypothetical protein [Nostoc sp.]|uniref:hypothetical protein n=1 Tax=Nostoc sp. TaxID=1180 RepID=UPI002FF4C5E6